MIPWASVEVDAAIPDDATYWVPKPSDISEEGFGYFRDVWPIVSASTRTTAAIISAERVAVEYVDLHASTGDEFEQVAIEIEHTNPDSLDGDTPAFISDFGSNWEGLAGLELGVAGLAYALSNSGFFPAASCRSHQNDRSWSPSPVVLFAGDRARVELLHPLVQEAGCGFEIAPERPELLCVHGTSIRETMALAGRLFGSRVQFRKLPKTSRKRSSGRTYVAGDSVLF